MPLSHGGRGRYKGFKPVDASRTKIPFYDDVSVTVVKSINTILMEGEERGERRRDREKK